MNLGLSGCVDDIDKQVGDFDETSKGVNANDEISMCLHYSVVEKKSCTCQCTYVRYRLKPF